MFFKKAKLKKEFDSKLISLMKETKDDWQQSQIIEELMDDYELSIIAQRKIAESKHFFLYKEARIRKILLK
ncbi:MULTISPECIES: YaaL family protein [Paenisporosarcina]|jgi:alpha/beta superfamily hydrolase|uniref:YaaL family protein n=1 Tax=Paenisporosarcina quisquiliarum TaxID=365346 RepID=A0A9X3LIN3_9BACL|nr:YaaL family protein [Paenisporosarcina quisquiliarum]MCZ8538616.1 YaaL family protein [Paenisporosarcina quisquiliarum]